MLAGQAYFLHNLTFGVYKIIDKNWEENCNAFSYYFYLSRIIVQTISQLKKLLVHFPFYYTIFFIYIYNNAFGSACERQGLMEFRKVILRHGVK